MNRKLIESIDTAMVDVLVRKNERERLTIAWGMWRSARTMISRMVAHEQVHWTPEQVDAEVARRLSNGAK